VHGVMVRAGVLAVVLLLGLGGLGYAALLRQDLRRLEMLRTWIQADRPTTNGLETRLEGMYQGHRVRIALERGRASRTLRVEVLQPIGWLPSSGEGASGFPFFRAERTGDRFHLESHPKGSFWISYAHRWSAPLKGPPAAPPFVPEAYTPTRIQWMRTLVQGPLPILEGHPDRLAWRSRAPQPMREVLRDWDRFAQEILPRFLSMLLQLADG
ncbi:MAG: hypothetical protein L3J76_05950, partial [Candidatus Hydrothermae bacterium]|nr:hypothetical protein [Candidatus Hydrothermae bacterium]